MKNKTSQSGFTLIELIAVMVILGILAAVIIPRITTITSGAYESNVRNMYGLIKNEITAQAVKAAMSGDFLETYPNPSNENENYYLKRWVSDYDPSAWSQFQSPSKYDNNAGTPDAAAGSGPDTHLLLFMYHPHGTPDEAVVWTGSTVQLTPAGGTSSKSTEDIYWIVYAPRTSIRGEDVGRELDGFAMAAWANGGTDDKSFGATISNGGVSSTGGPGAGLVETRLSDLDYILNPAADQ